MDRKIDEYLKIYGKKSDNHKNRDFFIKYIDKKRNKRKYQKQERKGRSSITAHRQKCKLCKGSTDTLPICRNCQMALFQLEELKKVLINALKNNEKPPEWALKASRKISEILSDYPEFTAYKNVVSEVVWIYLIDDEATIHGIELDEITSLKYTFKNRNEVITELYDLGIIEITNDRRIFPGKLLESLLDLKKVYGDNFASVNWELYTSAIQAIFILDITEKKIKKHIEGHGKRNPKQVLTVFKILAKVIENNLDNDERPENFYLPQIDFEIILTLLGDKRSRMKFYVNITGIKDGKAKLVEDIDNEDHAFRIHRDFNDYIVYMIERLREVERERDER